MVICLLDVLREYVRGDRWMHDQDIGEDHRERHRRKIAQRIVGQLGIEMRRNGERISMWGPYEVWHGAYVRFRTQKAFLESGQIGYQCVDTVGEAARKGNGCNCIHAISDLDPQWGRLEYPLAQFGQAASEHIVKQILERPIVIDPPRTHDWLIPALGLDRYPIIHRPYPGAVVPFSPEAVWQPATIPVVSGSIPPAAIA